MIRKSASGIEWLEFEILAREPGLVHGVFLRHGGVSSGPYASLNVGGGSGDEPGCVEENRRRLLQSLHLKDYVSGRQVHGDGIAVVEHAHQQVGRYSSSTSSRADHTLVDAYCVVGRATLTSYA